MKFQRLIRFESTQHNPLNQLSFLAIRAYFTGAACVLFFVKIRLIPCSVCPNMNFQVSVGFIKRKDELP